MPLEVVVVIKPLQRWNMEEQVITGQDQRWLKPAPSKCIIFITEDVHITHPPCVV